MFNKWARKLLKTKGRGFEFVTTRFLILFSYAWLTVLEVLVGSALDDLVLAFWWLWRLEFCDSQGLQDRSAAA